MPARLLATTPIDNPPPRPTLSPSSLASRPLRPSRYVSHASANRDVLFTAITGLVGTALLEIADNDHGLNNRIVGKIETATRQDNRRRKLLCRATRCLRSGSRYFLRVMRSRTSWLTPPVFSRDPDSQSRRNVPARLYISRLEARRRARDVRFRRETKMITLLSWTRFDRAPNEGTTFELAEGAVKLVLALDGSFGGVAKDWRKTSKLRVCTRLLFSREIDTSLTRARLSRAIVSARFRASVARSR